MNTLQAGLNGITGSSKQTAIKVGTATTLAEDGGREIQIPIYTLTLGNQTIELLPFKNWIQLDIHKWVVQGKLPASPAGLEVTLDHVKVAGQTVLHRDPEGCAKLEHVFNEWLELERGTLDLAQKRLHAKSTTTTAPACKRHETQPLHYHVQVDQEHQVHIQCLQGKEVLSTIGLNLPGFNSLADQGLLRKPRQLKVGVLHDWVELDGVLYSFEKENNDAVALERILNERYLSNLALGQGKDIVVFANAASSTGFDIQFTVQLGGVPDNRRRPLNEDTVDLLQDPIRCGLLQSGLVVKLTRPTLIFKQKTADGGERYLHKNADNQVILRGDAGQEKVIDLSQPVNYLRLSAVELTAVFNHPVINKHGKPAASASGQQGSSDTCSPEVFSMTSPTSTAMASSKRNIDPGASTIPATRAETQSTNEVTIAIPEKLPSPQVVSLVATKTAQSKQTEISVILTGTQAPPLLEHATDKPETVESLPNLWVKSVLAQSPIRFDWLANLLYDKLAEHFGNSHQGQLGPMSCWAVSLGDTEDLEDPAFKGIFLTEKHGLGFLHRGRMVRFYKGVGFIGSLEALLEGIGIELIAVGVDADQRVLFVVTDGYQERFDVPERTVRQELSLLKESGTAVMSVTEIVNSRVPLEILWTVPADQENPMDPQASEAVREFNLG